MVLVIEVNNMSEINIYINDQDKVTVKDDTQIIKMKGDRGEALRFEDLTEAQKAELKGPKGDKGEDGKSATAEIAYHTLLAGNVWCKDSTIDNVLVSMIGNLNKPFPRTEFIPLSVGAVTHGQSVVSVTGEPHYSVKIVGNDIDMFPITENGNGSVTIQPLGEDDVKLTYHNYLGDKVGEATIQGQQSVNEVAPDDTYENNGLKYSLYGRNLTINVAGSTYPLDGFDTDESKGLQLFGKWGSDAIDTITLKSKTKAKIMFTQRGVSGYKNQPIYVENTENVMIKNRDAGTTLNIGTKTQGLQMTTFNNQDITWDDIEHRYKDTGLEALEQL